MFMQRTLREKASCTGVGLHSGKRISLEVFPAPEDHGITFVRTDLPPHAELRASVEHVEDWFLWDGVPAPHTDAEVEAHVRPRLAEHGAGLAAPFA